MNKKEQFLKLMLLIFTAFIPSLNVGAEEIKVGDAKYNVENGNATLVEYKKAQGVVDVPSSITDKNALSYCVVAKKGGSWNKETITGVIEILGNAYSRHVEQERLKRC